MGERLDLEEPDPELAALAVPEPVLAGPREVEEEFVSDA